MSEKARMPLRKALGLGREEASNMDFNDISPELREKAKACTSPEELMALAKSES